MVNATWELIAFYFFSGRHDIVCAQPDMRSAKAFQGEDLASINMAGNNNAVTLEVTALRDAS